MAKELFVCKWFLRDYLGAVLGGVKCEWGVEGVVFVGNGVNASLI